MTSRIRWTGALAATTAASAFAVAANYTDAERLLKEGLFRSARIAATAFCVGVDYKWTLRSSATQNISEEERIRLKSALHLRNATRLLSTFKANGGIYIKLGQHIAAMVYLLPEEYTSTMKVLQDQCPPTSWEEIQTLVQVETGRTIEDLFITFDDKPIGVASLAQVHRAILKPSPDSPVQQEVAVKIQHPQLQSQCSVDIAMCSWLVRWAKRLFPEFEFDWLSEEMSVSLPKELDFVQEAANARKVSRNFEGDPVIKIPHVHYASKRLLVMEFVNGRRVDDLSFLKENKIDVNQVSNTLSNAFNKMIFVDGYVHCDPHPGNIFIVPHHVQRTWLSYFWPFTSSNFNLVILDHGLYRTLSPRMKYNYASLWDALIRFNEVEIEDACYHLFIHQEGRGKQKDGIDHHRLFASMLTGRPWAVLESTSNVGSLATSRSKLETDLVQSNLSQARFLIAMSEILAKLPREILLLLKTNDLLRAVDESLGVGSPISSAVTSRYTGFAAL